MFTEDHCLGSQMALKEKYRVILLVQFKKELVTYLIPEGLATLQNM